MEEVLARIVVELSVTTEILMLCGKTGCITGYNLADIRIKDCSYNVDAAGMEQWFLNYCTKTPLNDSLPPLKLLNELSHR